MKLENGTQPTGKLSPGGVDTSKTDRRKALVREMVAGAILPGLLARKDAGVFDRPPHVVRITHVKSTV